MPFTAQETPENKPLIVILNQLQDRFEVRFNYASDLVERISVKSPRDISDLTGQQITSIERARTRLRKKLGLANTNTNLVTFLSQI